MGTRFDMRLKYPWTLNTICIIMAPLWYNIIKVMPRSRSLRGQGHLGSPVNAVKRYSNSFRRNSISRCSCSAWNEENLLEQDWLFWQCRVVFWTKWRKRICSFERQLFVPEKWCIRIRQVIYFLLENNLSLSGWEWVKESIWVKSFDTPKFKQPRVKRLN